MKHIIFIVVFVFVASGVSAQKIVRDSIRSGNKAFEEQRYQVAESKFKSAIATDPASKDASFNLANTYYRQSKWDDALKEYQHYLTLESENKENMGAAWHNIGNTMLKKKDLKQAMESYKKALRLNPRDDEARYNLAVVQKILKDQEENEDKKKQPDQNDKDKEQQKKDKDKQDQQDQQNQDQNKDDQQKKPEQKDGQQQMSQENANQILKAIEEDEKQTQDKVNKMKAAERKKQNEDNKKQNKDW